MTDQVCLDQVVPLPAAARVSSVTEGYPVRRQPTSEQLRSDERTEPMTRVSSVVINPYPRPTNNDTPNRGGFNVFDDGVDTVTATTIADAEDANDAVRERLRERRALGFWLLIAVLFLGGSVVAMALGIAPACRAYTNSLNSTALNDTLAANMTTQATPEEVSQMAQPLDEFSQMTPEGCHVDLPQGGSCVAFSDGADTQPTIRRGMGAMIGFMYVSAAMAACRRESCASPGDLCWMGGAFFTALVSLPFFVWSVCLICRIVRLCRLRPSRSLSPTR